MNLLELFALTDGKEDERTPGRCQLLERGERILKEYAQIASDSPSIRIRVFESGYVLYEEDCKTTVFHIREALLNPFDNDERTRMWDLNEKEQAITRKLLMENDWKIGLFLYGNSRIMNNRYKFEEKKVSSYHRLAEDITALEYFAPFLKEMEAEIELKKMKTLFELLMKRLKPTQWTVYVSIERDKRLQKDIADELGITQQEVSKEYKKACEQIIELQKFLKKYYYED